MSLMINIVCIAMSMCLNCFYHIFLIYFGNYDIMTDFQQFKALESYFINKSETKILSPKILQYFKYLLGVHYENSKIKKSLYKLII